MCLIGNTPYSVVVTIHSAHSFERETGMAFSDVISELQQGRVGPLAAVLRYSLQKDGIRVPITEADELLKTDAFRLPETAEAIGKAIRIFYTGTDQLIESTEEPSEQPGEKKD